MGNRTIGGTTKGEKEEEEQKVKKRIK